MSLFAILATEFVGCDLDMKAVSVKPPCLHSMA